MHIIKTSTTHSVTCLGLRADAVEVSWLLILPVHFGNGTMLSEGCNLRHKRSLLEVEPMDAGAALTRHAVQDA